MRPIHVALISSALLLALAAITPTVQYRPQISSISLKGNVLQIRTTAKGRVNGMLLYEDLDPSALPIGTSEMEYRQLAADNGARLIGVARPDPDIARQYLIELTKADLERARNESLTYSLAWVWPGGMVLGGNNVTSVIRNSRPIRYGLLNYIDFSAWCVLLAILIPAVTAVVSGFADYRAARRASEVVANSPPAAS
jgi:hypothetical protein